MGGEDYLGSGRGNDLMIGGADSDIFEFNAKNGHDTVKDIQDGPDVIFSNFPSWKLKCRICWKNLPPGSV
jgi:hypothetical protein